MKTGVTHLLLELGHRSQMWPHKEMACSEQVTAADTIGGNDVAGSRQRQAVQPQNKLPGRCCHLNPSGSGSRVVSYPSWVVGTETRRPFKCLQFPLAPMLRSPDGKEAQESLVSQRDWRQRGLTCVERRRGNRGTYSRFPLVIVGGRG